jgi:hypothetical protein
MSRTLWRMAIKLHGSRTNRLFRYGVLLLDICGGRNEYVDRSHVDGSGRFA